MTHPDGQPLPRRRLTRDEVRAIRDQARIEEIAADHTELRRASRQLKGLCPLHRERTPSFFVDPDRQLWKCFGCGAGGDAIALVEQLYHVDFRLALEYVAARFGIPPQGLNAGSQ